jgi:N-acetylglutamate synthase-like GNAT family acetyltransferase
MKNQCSAHVRQFRLSDLSAVRELIHNTIDVSYCGFYPPRAIQFFKEIHSEKRILQRSREGEVLVVETDGRIIGTGSLSGKEILGVFIRHDLQHQGQGRALMRALEQKALAKDIRETELSISLPSRRFYENLGYEIIASRTIDVGEGQRLDYWQAKKTLQKGTAGGASMRASRKENDIR